MTDAGGSGFGRTFLAPFLGAALAMATVLVERTARVARAGAATTGVPTREVMANIVSRVYACVVMGSRAIAQSLPDLRTHLPG